ncbi:allophanate hydrolase subunit 1 [Devosia algicola]|uniref:Allophanate hydrolase subunit 1 n=1 Tax=Devosia algicola TaxID=3026418 RepID=A0ABY7YPN5_9HYPH|nr:allophanate hydrolase subunit 1 [Devosia algicola]WDR03284.1 allophanate hydrolase subunit 1 [Devosia algicola]
MRDPTENDPIAHPLIVPLGDRALLVRFAATLSVAANAAATSFAKKLAQSPPDGVTEIVPSLVSVQINYDPAKISPDRLAAELSLIAWSKLNADGYSGQTWRLPSRFGGEYGPDLEAVAHASDLDVDAFIDAHNATELRVLATGFAPGFVYCGFHGPPLQIPRRSTVRNQVPPGSILFAVGQTAVAATEIPTGWHVIGQTDFRNFDPASSPPTRFRAGDRLIFERTT